MQHSPEYEASWKANWQKQEAAWKGKWEKLLNMPQKTVESLSAEINRYAEEFEEMRDNILSDPDQPSEIINWALDHIDSITLPKVGQ